MLWLLRWVLVGAGYQGTTIPAGTERVHCNNAALAATVHAQASFTCRTFTFPLVTIPGN